MRSTTDPTTVSGGPSGISPRAEACARAPVGERDSLYDLRPPHRALSVTSSYGAAHG